MKFAFAVLAVLALSAGTLVAQSANRSYGVAGMEGMLPAQSGGQQAAVNKTAADTIRIYSGCPVSMRAQHLADGELIKAGKAKPQGIGQRLHLTLIAPDSRRIAKATLMIRGLSPKGRVTQAAGAGAADATTTVTVGFTAGADRHDVADIRVPGMSAVQSIEVDSIVYADGSTWQLTGGQACRVTPDAFMPVTQR